MDYEKHLSKKPNWKNRRIFICGLDIISFGVRDFLQKHGKDIEGIIDKSCKSKTQLFGTYLYPVSFLETGYLENCFFVITAFKESHRKYYEILLTEKYGEENVIVISDTTEIRIDISGICNLRCPSCQVANHDQTEFDYTRRGFMDVGLFEQILRKIKTDYPENPAIYLFVLGEPVMHPEISRMIDLVHKYDFMAIVSTNLSYKKDLEALLKSEPDVLKISLSGFSQEIYGATHCRGDVELVKENMKQIADILNTKQLKTKVMVGYHVYTNNRGEEMENMGQLCRELGFLFQPVNAMYFNMLKCTGHTPFSKSDIEFISSYYEAPEEIFNVSQCAGEPGECRNLRDKLFIDYDGKVMLCELFHKDAKYHNYLETSPEEIDLWRKEHWICKRCRTYGMHLK